MNATNTGSALRGAAEVALGEHNAQQSAPGPAASTSEASERALHELQVHQIQLEMQNEHGETALHCAAERGNIDCVRVKKKRGLMNYNERIPNFSFSS